MNQTENNPNLEIRSAPQNGTPRLANGLAADWAVYSDELPVVAYALALKSSWRIIALSAGVCMLLTFVTTEFIMTPRYRATAVLRPVTPLDGLDKLTGVTGALASEGAADVLSGLSEESSEAQKYLSILRSYAFTDALIEHYRLTPQIVSGYSQSSNANRYTKWRLYTTTQKQFDCSYDDLSGNMTLHFVSSDPRTASRILSLYIDSLREKLRHEEVQSALAAKISLEDEAKATPDLLLQSQLYELIARQVQREKLAQVEADFAFTVIEPPIVPDGPYSPRVKLFSALAGLLGAVVVGFALILRESWSHSLRRYYVMNRSRVDACATGNGKSDADVEHKLSV